ncbi:MAG: single-stranded DNA-binding protein [Actinomycetes bacterium]
MNETMVTVVGHVATEPALRTTAGGAHVASFRLAATERRFDKGTNGWRDGPTTFYTVTSWRNMAENVCDSIEKGQPVVVHGRLRDSSYDGKDGQRRFVLEVEAFAVGHDLSRGVATFTKSTVSAAAGSNVFREIEELDGVDPVTGETLGGAPGDGFPHEDDDDLDQSRAVTSAA